MKISYQEKTFLRAYEILPDGSRRLVRSTELFTEQYSVEFRLSLWGTGWLVYLMLVATLTAAGVYVPLLPCTLAVVLILLIFATSYKHEFIVPQK